MTVSDDVGTNSVTTHFVGGPTKFCSACVEFQTSNKTGQRQLEIIVYPTEDLGAAYRATVDVVQTANKLYYYNFGLDLPAGTKAVNNTVLMCVPEVELYDGRIVVQDTNNIDPVNDRMAMRVQIAGLTLDEKV